MIEILTEIANDYIRYTTGQNNWKFPRADFWQLYKLNSRTTYTNAFPMFNVYKQDIFKECKKRLNMDRNITEFVLVKHNDRSFQMPVKSKIHAYIPLSSIDLVVTKQNNLDYWLHIYDFELFPWQYHKLKYLKREEPTFFDSNWQTVVYPKNGDIYFYVEFET